MENLGEPIKSLRKAVNEIQKKSSKFSNDDFVTYIVKIKKVLWVNVFKLKDFVTISLMDIYWWVN